ncbi:aldehyde dehydrogenase family protein [Streptomyces mutabilis]|uniref:Aldehyde dehydrogenase n=1 Tax=Streptomyces mutabilis TaxID=67332 RepID=A0A086MRX3_9ACTN|nr:aldehyde dehydrogenase family protein [Streptomyces mutabilis]KFG71641.1 aldehyde dehydrogenase [Streptomyces mutabilis]
MTVTAPDQLVSADPRDGRTLGQYPVHGTAEVSERVDAARAAAPAWARLGHAGRARDLDAWRRLILRRVGELVRLISAETGKTRADAQLEVILVADHLRWAAAHAGRVLRPRRVPTGMLMFHHTATVEHHPLGVVGVIGPWNYPAFIPVGPVAHALAAGNTVVFKPSEYTPAAGAWLVATFAEATGRPDVLQAVFGRGDTGAALCRSGVDKIAFTGSTETGKRVMAACAENLTPVLLECGGKDAVIVDRDADLDSAADAVVWGGLANAGQTCIGVERVYVHQDVADRFTETVVDRAAALRTGPGPDAHIGPMATPGQPGIVLDHIRDALSRGGRALLGGPESVRAPYVSPVILADVPEDADVLTRETFGPVLVINRVRSAAEAVERANACAYGLGAAVFSRTQATAIARRLRVGMVSVNSVLAFAGIPALPFGGTGASGFGRVHGPEGLREFTRTHSVARQWLRPPVQPLSFRRSDRTMDALVRLVRVVHGAGRSGPRQPGSR